MSDIETIASVLADWHAHPEESGGLSIVGLEHKTNGGASGTAVQAFTPKNCPVWSDSARFAELVSIISQKWSDQIASGGAQQFVLAGCFGTDPRPKRFFPLVKLSRAMVQAAPGMPTDPATPVGALQQGMRLSELLVQGSFKQNADNATTAATIIDRLMRRVAELEVDQRELLIVVKTMMVEFHSAAHQMRMSEIQAMRAAQFQRRMLELLPALLGTIGVDALPENVEAASILDTVAGSFPRKDRDTLVNAVAARPNGAALASVLHRWFSKYDEKQAADKAEDERMMTEIPLSSYAKAAEDAAGRAAAALRGHAPQLDEKKTNGTNGTNGATNGHATNGHAETSTVVVVEKAGGEAERLRELLFSAVPSEEEFSSLVSMLRLKGANELADEMSKQFAEHQGRKGKS